MACVGVCACYHTPLMARPYCSVTPDISSAFTLVNFFNQKQDSQPHDVIALGRNPLNLTTDFFLDHHSSCRRGIGQRNGTLPPPTPAPRPIQPNKSNPCRVKVFCLHQLWSGGFGLADTAPYLLIRLIDASHRCISSFKSSPLQGKVRKKTTTLLGLIPNLTCDVSLPFHMHQHITTIFQFVTLCKELQKIRIICIIVMICKVYIFKSCSRHKTEHFILIIDEEY